MGREIRMVPPDWEHPRYTKENCHRESQIGNFIPLYDEDYDSACEKWLEKLDSWRNGTYPNKPENYKYFWDWDGGPPDDESYRDRRWIVAEATHYQVYETVSEGTPVTPHFSTKRELIDYLATNGTYWDSGRPWPLENAERFVEDEWAPSGIASASTGFKTVNEAGFYPRPQGAK